MNSEKIFTVTFIKLCTINFIMMLGAQLVNTLIPKYVNYLGQSAVVVGIVASVFSISSLIAKPFSGQATDRLDKKKVLFFSMLIIMISSIGYSVSKTIEWLIVFRLVQGVGVAFVGVVCLTMVSCNVSKEKLTSAIAFYSVAGAIAQSIGPSIAIALSQHLSYFFSYLISAIIFFIACLLTLTLEKQVIQEKKSFQLSFDNIIEKRSFLPAVIIFFLSLVYVNISSFLVLYAESIHVNNIGLYFTVNALILLFSRPVIAKGAEKFGIFKVMPIAIICFGISVFLIGMSTNLTMFLIAAVINAFGYGACQPLIQSLAMGSVSIERRGVASATSYYGTDLGYLLGPLIAGIITNQTSYAVMFRVMPLILVIPLVIIICFRKKFI